MRNQYNIGYIALRGCGEPNLEVEVYIDGKPVGATSIDDNGRWQLEALFNEAGKYAVTLDSIGHDGEIYYTSRPVILIIPTSEPEFTATPIETSTNTPTLMATPTLTPPELGLPVFNQQG